MYANIKSTISNNSITNAQVQAETSMDRLIAVAGPKDRNYPAVKQLSLIKHTIA